MKKFYMVTAVVLIHPKGADARSYDVDVCIPFDMVRANPDPAVIQTDLRVKVLRHLAHRAIFDEREGYAHLAEIMSRGQETYDVSFGNLTYKIITEYRQWLPTEYPSDLEHIDLMAGHEIERAAEVRCMANVMLHIRDVYHGAISCLEALMKAKSPLWDGDVPSKSGRDTLFDLKLATRVIHNGEDGYTTATYLGRDVYRELQRQRELKAREETADATSGEGSQPTV